MSWIITSDQVSPPSDAAITYGITNAGGVFNLRSTGTVDYEAEWGDGNVEISTLNVRYLTPTLLVIIQWLFIVMGFIGRTLIT